jgi:hypothetical protein
MVEITEDMDLVDMMISGGGREGSLMSPDTPQTSRFQRYSRDDNPSTSQSSTVDELIEDDIRNAQAALSRTIGARGGINSCKFYSFV